MRKEDMTFLAQLCQKEAEEAKLQAARERQRVINEANAAKAKASISAGRTLQKQLLAAALKEQVLPQLTVVGRVTWNAPGPAVAYLNYELLPLVFIDDLSYGEFRWYISRRLEHAPRDIKRSFQSITGKRLRRMFEGVLVLHREAATHPEDYPGWMSIRAERLPFSQRVKQAKNLTKSWLGDGMVIYTTK